MKENVTLLYISKIIFWLDYWLLQTFHYKQGNNVSISQKHKNLNVKKVQNIHLHK